MRKITLSHNPELRLPIDSVTQKLGFIGRTGSGKTYAATKLAEEFFAMQAQFIALDPVGVWWGLRLNEDGKTPGFSIPVFGGLHGDIPLEASSGKLIADLIVSKRISAIIDVSHFESDSDKTRFSTDFADRFYYLKKSNPSAVHIFLEECQEFIPQNIQRGEERMLHAFQRMIRLGRNFGIGASMITQRPQDVNKKALNQAECVFAFQLTGPQERKAVDLWMNDKGLDLDLANDLPKLNIGEAHVWSPAWLKISEVVKIDKKQTYNASSTPEVGKKSQSRQLASIDIEVLRDQMQATIEKAKQEDPRELRKKIEELQKILKTYEKSAQQIKTEVKTKEIPVLKDSQIDKMCNAFTGLTEHMIKAMEIMNPIHKSVMIVKEFQIESRKIQAVLFSKDKTTGNYIVDANTQIAPEAVKKMVSQYHDSRREVEKATWSGDKPHINKPALAAGKLPIGEEKILSALIQYPGGLQRKQLTVLIGYKQSARDTYISRLSQRGYCTLGNNSTVIVTQEGINALPNYEPLPTGKELQEYWMKELPRGEALILSHLIQAYPDSVSRNELTEKTSYKQSARDTYISRLTSRELLNISGQGLVRASENLF